GNDGCWSTSSELLYVRDDGLVVAVSKRGVLLHDVGFRYTLGLEEVAQDLVGSAGIDVVRAEQHPLFCGASFLAHEVLHGGNSLLIGSGSCVEDVEGSLLALVLHRIKQETVELLELRQHALA